MENIHVRMSICTAILLSTSNFLNTILFKVTQTITLLSSSSKNSCKIVKIVLNSIENNITSFINKLIMGKYDKCNVPNCNWKSQEKLLGLKNLSLFKVPKDETERQTWSKILKCDNFKISHHVCEKHFAESDLIESKETFKKSFNNVSTDKIIIILL